jgi:hypothetical protein
LLFVLSICAACASLAWGIGNLLLPNTDAEHPPLERVAIRLVLGYSSNLVLVLFGLELTSALWFSLLLGSAGIARSLLSRNSLPLDFSDRARFALAAGLLLIFAIPILSSPLADWDARSIWFFHARIISLDAGIHRRAAWAASELAWSQPDYPKLVPTLAAEVVSLAGFWNEYVPKGALLLLLAPPVALLASAFEWSAAWLLLAVSWLLGQDSLLWNGYMDGFLAIYIAGAAWQLSVFLRDGLKPSLATGLGFLGIACSLKNEGILFSFAVLGTFFAASLLRGGTWVRALTLRPLSIPITALVAMAPTALWASLKLSWGLHNGLGIGSMAWLLRLKGRVLDGRSTTYVMHALLFSESAAWKAACVFFVATTLLALRRRVSAAPFHAFGAAFASFLALCIIYLATPFDLEWHINTSASRTMRTVVALMMTSIAFILRALITPINSSSRSPNAPRALSSTPLSFH